MKILFSVSHFGFLRNFEPALRRLAERGHRIHLLADRKDNLGGTKTIANLLAATPDGSITWGYVPSRKDDPWYAFALRTRSCLDYWRYLDRRYDHAVALRERAATQAPDFASRITAWPVIGSRPVMGMIRTLFGRVERALPPGRIATDILEQHAPDLLLVTPLLYFGSPQVDYVRAARARGIPTVLGVGSWDHLTTKGMIHEVPDRLTVWNEPQRQEAAEIHRIDPARVDVTGAQAYDHWFVSGPQTTREAFCAARGLDASRPILLYLCSSPFITPYEVGFVRKWIAAVRGAADPTLRGANILVRPHPQNAEQWRNEDLSADAPAALFPRAGANPVDAEARADYYDSMFHSAVVIGINTSAQIESAIIGRPVCTIHADEFARTQEGTLHFQHLKGGLVHMASAFPEHLQQLSHILANPDQHASRSREFVQFFVRPHGLETPAADVFVTAIERAAVGKPEGAALRTAADRGLLDRVLLAMAAPIARAVQVSARRPKPTARHRPDAAAGTFTILFNVASPEYLRFYDATMTRLAERGHRVLVAVDHFREEKQARLGMAAGVEDAGFVPARGDIWMELARSIRATVDFVRYLHPKFTDAVALRARMKRKVLPSALHWIDRVRSVRVETLNRVLRSLQTAERAVPVSRTVATFLRERQPDVVVVSPLIDAASPQVDMVRAARAVGTPVAAAIASWDNLTNKGLMRVEPDRVIVWNRAQQQEAAEYHGIPPEKVVITGAQPFDRWFGRSVSQSREDFCRMVGLPAEKPFLLYTASSVFIARSEFEVPFVRRWIEALRASDDPAVRDLAVLVRPHPYNAHAWQTAELPGLGDVAVYPHGMHNAVDEGNRNTFFDSMFHSVAVVGINTSAMIESAIVGRPVFSILSPEFGGTQEGTLHFHYLLPEHGGFLRVATGFDQHVAQLSATLRDSAAAIAETRRFVASFVRPNGLDRECTGQVADAIEALAREGATVPEPDRIGSRLLRVALGPLALVVHLWPGGRKSSLRRRVRDAVKESRKALRRRWKAVAAPRRDKKETKKRTRPVPARGGAADAGGVADRKAVKPKTRKRPAVAEAAMGNRDTPVESR